MCRYMMISGSYMCNTYDTHIWVSYTCYDTLYDCHIRVTHVQTHMWHTYMCIIWSNLQILFVHMCESYMIHIYDYDLTCLIWLSHILYTYMNLFSTYVIHIYDSHIWVSVLHIYDTHIWLTHMSIWGTRIWYTPMMLIYYTRIWYTYICLMYLYWYII